ncbi:MAG: hypothetical protein PHN64_07480 [Desulfovibrionaceae bacterium]|nr:hypothetical protein [Desulfovibrionaceae bacterium]
MQRNLFLRTAAFVGIPCFVWIFMMYITPYMLQFCPNWQHYVNHVEDAGITNPGVLYYNDVPAAAEAERIFRDTVRFLPKEQQPEQ